MTVDHTTLCFSLCLCMTGLHAHNTR